MLVCQVRGEQAGVPHLREVAPRLPRLGAERRTRYAGGGWRQLVGDDGVHHLGPVRHPVHEHAEGLRGVWTVVRQVRQPVLLLLL